MLDINMEFRKGILFVRLKGVLSNNTCKKLDQFLKEIITEKIIRYVVFNISQLQYIDLDGINILLFYNQILVENNGQTLICGIKDELIKFKIRNSKMLDYISEINNELDAINLINI
jgi:anti-anti-sigma factor